MSGSHGANYVLAVSLVLHTGSLRRLILGDIILEAV